MVKIIFKSRGGQGRDWTEIMLPSSAVADADVVAPASGPTPTVRLASERSWTGATESDTSSRVVALFVRCDVDAPVADVDVAVDVPLNSGLLVEWLCSRRIASHTSMRQQGQVR